MEHTSINEELLKEEEIQLIERALLLYEKKKSVEQEMSPEELQELWGGLKNLVNKGYNRVKTATDRAATAVGNAAYDSTIGAAKKVGNAVSNAASNAATAINNKATAVKDKVADTYNQGEVDSIVQKIYALNNKYKALTGKSFVRQYGAAAKATPRAAKRPAQPETAAQMAMAECVRMQHLAGLISESKE